MHQVISWGKYWCCAKSTAENNSWDIFILSKKQKKLLRYTLNWYIIHGIIKAMIMARFYKPGML